MVMGKKKSSKSKQSKAFSGFKRDKKSLKGPFTQMSEKHPGFLGKSAWHDVQLPEYMWVALILSGIDSTAALAILRSVAAQWPTQKDFKGGFGGPAGSFTSIAALKAPARRKLLSAIATEIGDRSILAPLCRLEGLPCLNDWKSVFGDENSDDHWFALADAVEICSQFQGENATHICWLASCVGAASGQMTAPEEMNAMRAEYPENANSVGGFFRCEVGSMREIMRSDWTDQFWIEVYMKLGPAAAPPEHQYLTDNDLGTAYYFTSILGHISEHYWETRKRSDDRVHEMAFGIVLAAVTLAYEVIELRTQNRFGGLAALRTLTESAINLSFLASKNDPDLWHRFRRYGMGQAHLIATKLENDLGSSHCVDPTYINAFLHEEDPNMFTDIELGDWAGENIRTRAEVGGTKDLYDSYYDYASSLLHADWLGAATFGLTWDLNPLHRLQKVPRQFPRSLPSVLPDMCVVTNRILETLDSLYPSFEFRLPEYRRVENGNDETTETQQEE